MKILLQIIAAFISGAMVLGAVMHIEDNTRMYICIGFAFVILIAAFAPGVFKKLALGLVDKVCSYRGGKNDVDKPES